MNNSINQNSPRPLNDFEQTLLTELRDHVAHRAAHSSPQLAGLDHTVQFASGPRRDNGGRRAARRWAVGLAAAAISGIASVTSIIGSGTAPASAAYTVEDTGDAVTITVFDLTDEAGLQADLLAHGIDADVNWRVEGDLPPDAPAGAPFNNGENGTSGPVPKALPMPTKVHSEEGSSWVWEDIDSPQVPDPTGPECTGDTETASFTKVDAAWELTVPDGSLLMDRHVYMTAYRASNGVQVVVDYESTRAGEFCTLRLDD